MPQSSAAKPSAGTGNPIPTPPPQPQNDSSTNPDSVFPKNLTPGVESTENMPTSANKGSEEIPPTGSESEPMPVVVPAGAEVRVELLQSTDSLVIGDTFSAKTSAPVAIGNSTAIPAGAEIDGQMGASGMRLSTIYAGGKKRSLTALCHDNCYGNHARGSVVVFRLDAPLTLND
jgi:hypothetical protein